MNLTLRCTMSADGKISPLEHPPGQLRSLLAAGLVAEIEIILRSTIEGGAQAFTLTGPPGDFFPSSIPLRLEAMEQVGEECRLRYRVL